MSSYVILSYPMSSHVILCHPKLSYVILSYSMSSHVILRHPMSSCIILSHPISFNVIQCHPMTSVSIPLQSGISCSSRDTDDGYDRIRPESSSLGYICPDNKNIDVWERRKFFFHLYWWTFVMYVTPNRLWTEGLPRWNEDRLHSENTSASLWREELIVQRNWNYYCHSSAIWFNDNQVPAHRSVQLARGRSW